MVNEAEYVPLVFQEEFTTSTMEVFTALVELPIDNSNVDGKVEVFDIKSANEEESNQQDD